ncbi:MAG: TonB-dependent receptor [Sphingomonadales bacterium]|nr:TonB-dependent receptor [Sphingomonadales bacterium]
MASTRHLRVLASAASALAILAYGQSASARSDADQPPPADAPAPPQAATGFDNGEIIVTARKRQESLLNVPVIEQVVTGSELAQRQTVDLKDLTEITPGLMIGTTVLSIGQQVSIRGVGTTSFDPGIDQSVSLNIDGLSLGQGLAYSSGMFDIGQVEVLKGPQSLFYGKSSPGGVISLRTADPTDKTEVIGSFGYEGEAHTKRGELIISGPIADGLKVRLAGMYEATDGYYYNNAIGIPALGGLTPQHNRMGYGDDYQIRGTVLYNSGNFDARLKVNLVHDFHDNAENYEVTYCPDGTGAPYGIPFLNPNLSCQKNRVGYVVDMNPADFYGGLPNGGESYVDSNQYYGSLEMNYHFSPNLTATSVTGLYILRENSVFNASASQAAGPLIAANNPNFRRDDITEEVRLNSDYATPFNFTVGGFYQHGKVSDRVTILGNEAINAAFANGPIQDGLNQFTIDSYSLFGQLRYKITPRLELAAGARWTDETRVQTPLLYPSLDQLGYVFAPGGAQINPAYAAQTEVVPVVTPRIHSSPVSPEVTLTYKPDENMTLFASYKQGNKSGSFSIATPQSLIVTAGCAYGTANPCRYLDNSFGDEKVQGGELGLKGRTADRQLHFDMSGFYYVYTGLQVGSIIPTVGSTPVITTINAGKAKVYGLEADVDYQPEQVKGLTITANLAYTHARFTDLNGVPCYGGQTVQAGCNQEFTPFVASPGTPTPASAGSIVVKGVTGNYFAQGLTGSPLIRAPDWQVNLGFNYALPVGNSMTLTFSEANHFTSRYLTALEPLPAYYQSAFIKADLGVTLAANDRRWELALIGKNITGEYTAGNCSSSNTANGLLGGEFTGGTTAGPAGTDEGSCYMDPGRELWIRLTLRPFS